MDLPPLPPSDKDSLRTNGAARKFWGQNEINYIELKEEKPCEHFFIRVHDGFQCNKCHFGLFGYFDLIEGELFYEGKKVDFTRIAP